MSLQEKQIVDEHIGNFHVVELIGHGAMASVYRAFDTELERDVALKIPNPKYTENTGFIQRFYSEAKAMAKLCHRNIVQIYSAGEHEGAPFLAMEYVSGAPLSRILADRGRMEVEEAVEYILQICEAIECAHKRGVVHRDIKPSNILVESSGRVLVADFGIAKMVSGSTCEDTLTFVGTPIYMSPEQCGEGVLDQRTDIYSLGVIFYEMIVGKPPFDGESPAEIIKNHLMMTPKFPEEQGAELPPKIVNIVRKMLAKNPEERYPDALTLRQDLELWQKEPRPAPKPPTQESSRNGMAPIVLCYIPQKILHGAVASALKNIKHRMIAVSSGTELLRGLSNLETKMVILSHQPGRTSIFRLAEKIRKSPKNTQVQLMLLSHGISREEVGTAFRSGINDIIAEPFDPSILVAKLETALVGEQKSIESRRFFRKAISGKVTVRIESEILDISEGGMRISTNMALKIGELIWFELKLFRELGLGEKAGKVAWVSKNDSDAHFLFQAGIDFVDVTKAERDILRKWIFSTEVTGRAGKHSSRPEPDMGPFLI
ncbi:MAG: protein kinase [Candidatus Hydrogenedentota bacterium]|nr:MAG: protein kinase [Candidatus Hydrogenedentota bacterium]